MVLMDLEKQVDAYLEVLINAFANHDSFKLRKLSNELIEKAVLEDAKQFVDLALVSYALSKLVRKQHFLENPKWDEFEKSLLYKLRTEVKKPTTAQLMPEILSELMNEIKKFDEEAGNYVDDVIKQARVKQGSRIYALGFSLAKAAEFTGVSKAELAEYVGITKIHERPFTQSMALKDRYNLAKKVLEKL